MTTDWKTKTALVVGFILLIAATYIVRSAPAHTYEVSIYRGTPLAYWGTIGGALLLAVLVGFAADGRFSSIAATVLGGGSALSVTALPLLRGYHYYGESDSMTHLGWARELVARVTAPADLIYPGIHLDGIALRSLLGVDMPTALMLVVAVFALAYLVFTTLAISRFVSADGGLIVGIASACLFLPINNIAIEISPHPISQSVFFFAFVVFIALQYVIPSVHSQPSRNQTSGYGVLLALTSLSTVLYHPQMAIVVLVLFGAFSLVQWYFRWSHVEPFTNHRTLYGQTIFLAIAIIVWVGLHDVLVQQFQYIGRTIVEAMMGRAEVGTVVQQRRSSLTDVGSGPLEIFLKLFLVSALYVLLSALFLLTGLAERFLSIRWDNDAVATYMLFGSVSVALFSALQFIGDFSRLFFRYLGIMMVIGTILGGAELAYRLDARQWTRIRTGGATFIMIVLIAFSLVTVYPSPYTYQPSAHKTEASMDGYETAFEHAQSDVEFSGIGYYVWRYHDATVPRETGERGEQDRAKSRMGSILAPEIIRTNLTTHFEHGQYIPVTDADRGRELDAVSGIQYSPEDFARLASTPGVNRVQSTSGMSLYYVPERRNRTA